MAAYCTKICSVLLEMEVNMCLAHHTECLIGYVHGTCILTLAVLMHASQ